MDYISREAAISIFNAKADMALGTPKLCFIAAAKMIEALPAADVREAVRGKWIEEPGLIPRCAVCGKYSDDAATGEAICCAFCGAMMGGK